MGRRYTYHVWGSDAGVSIWGSEIEGSSFTGREPDEKRYDFDKLCFDSLRGRLSYNPTAKWPLQASHGFIYDISKIDQTRMVLSGQLSVYKPDHGLQPLYGTTPMAGEIYIRIYPATL